MKMIKLGRTVNLGERGKSFTEMDEFAYALATAMMPSLLAYEAARKKAAEALAKEQSDSARLKNVLTDLDKRRQAVGHEVHEASRRLSEAQDTLGIVEQRPWRFFRFIWMLFFGRKWRAELAQAQEHVQGANDALKEKKRQEQALADEHHSTASRHQQSLALCHKLEQEKRRLDNIPRIVTGLRSLDYPIVPLVIQRGKVDRRRNKVTPRVSIFIEPNAPPRHVELPKVDIDKARLERTEELLAELDRDTILLDPGEEGEQFGSWGKLYGSEQSLKEAIDLLSEIVENFSPREYNLPVVNKATALGRFISSCLQNISQHPASDVSLDQRTLEQYEAFTTVAREIQDLLEANQARREAIDRLIEGLRMRFESDFGRLQHQRELSRDLNDEYLRQSRINSYLIRYHFFCPKCNATPAYLDRVFKISTEEIDSLSTTKIATCLKQYQSSCFSDSRGQKFDGKDRGRICSSWENAFEYLYWLEERFNDAQEEPTPGDNGTNATKLAYLKREQTTFRRLYRTTIVDLVKSPLKEWKRPAVGGQAEEADYSTRRTLDVMNQNTRLLFHPERDDRQWECPNCETRFSHDEARLGAVDKVRYDIIYPMIHALWNEDSIWSKRVDLLKDIAREIRDRRIEESNTLQAPIDQFLADSRILRQRLQDAFASGKAAAGRLEQMSGQFEQVGLLERHELDKVRDAAHSATAQIDSVDQRLGQINSIESQMQEVPKQVFVDRLVPVPPSSNSSSPIRRSDSSHSGV